MIELVDIESIRSIDSTELDPKHTRVIFADGSKVCSCGLDSGLRDWDMRMWAIR